MRAEKLDEGLAVYDGLMRGQPFTFAGKHYQVQPTDFVPAPAPVQQPRVPVWVMGAYPSPKSMRRAACWDGLLPTKVGTGPDASFGPSDLAEVVARCGRYGRKRACPGTASTWSPRASARPGRPATP